MPTRASPTVSSPLSLLLFSWLTLALLFVLAHIAFSKSVNVKQMTFDNDAELYKIQKIFPEAELVLRILPPNNQAAVCNFGSKFGAYFSDCKALAKLARELGLKIVGVSFHVGSGCFTLTAYEQAVRQARAVFDECIKEGHEMTVLDIGGTENVWQQGNPHQYNL